MNYWAVGSTFDGKEDISNDFFSKKEWYDGYAENGNLQYKNYLTKVEVGDILIMKSSATRGQGHKITFTRIKGVGIVKEKKDWYWFGVEWINLSEEALDIDGVSYRKTFEPLREDILKDYVIKLIKDKDMQKSLLENIKLLKFKKQIILQGAPGTGKTYTAKKIAEQLILGEELLPNNIEHEKKMDEQYKLIQFHPSYSYEDFVRGIVAESINGQISYETKNKVLAKFADEASKSKTMFKNFILQF